MLLRNFNRRSTSVNRVIYILDASGSMRHRVKETCALTKASIAKLKADDRVSLLTFEQHTVREVFADVPAKNVTFVAKDYQIGGGTNLLDAVNDGVELLLDQSQAKTCAKHRPKDTYLVIILTDGGENTSSRFSKSQLCKILNGLQSTDLWTFAWMVPPNCIDATKQLGIDESNIFGWTDIKEAAQALSGGMDNLAKAKAAGKTALRTGFFADLSGVSKSEIRKQLTDVSAKVRRAKVTKKETIKAFCLREFGEYVAGNAMYQLTETETVQDYKEVALIDKRRPDEIFLGGRGVLGLPDGTVRLKASDNDNYIKFIGSKSVNRATDPGTEILYGDQIGLISNQLVS